MAAPVRARPGIGVITERLPGIEAPGPTQVNGPAQAAEHTPDNGEQAQVRTPGKGREQARVRPRHREGPAERPGRRDSELQPPARTGLRLRMLEHDRRAERAREPRPRIAVVGIYRPLEAAPARQPARDNPGQAAAHSAAGARRLPGVRARVARQVAVAAAGEPPAEVGVGAEDEVAAGAVAEAADESGRIWNSFFALCEILRTHMNTIKKWSFWVAFGSLVLVFALSPAKAVEMGKSFATPEDAVSALKSATLSKNAGALREIFGPDVNELKNPDRVQATNEIEAFGAALLETNRIDYSSDTNCELEVGANLWPFPVPLVKVNGKWFFDTEAGKEELLNRRVGRNELDVLATMRAYVDAQRDYASKYRDGADVLQYAQRLASTPGRHDGLYWPQDNTSEESPLGPLVADAQTEGYQVQSQGQQTTRAPFHGYYFKILTRQGPDAPGGKYDYIINGHMIAGFGLIAWPADYGNSGVMTFIVNQQGRVYQKDLGPETEQLAPAITEYNPGPGWSLSKD